MCLDDGDDVRGRDADASGVPDGQPDLAEPYGDLFAENEAFTLRRDPVQDSAAKDLPATWRSGAELDLLLLRSACGVGCLQVE